MSQSDTFGYLYRWGAAGRQIPHPIKSKLIMVLDRLINANSHGKRGIIIVWIDQEIPKECWVAEVGK